MITLDQRPPVRILHSGTFPLPGMPGCSYTIGHDAVTTYPWQDLPEYVAVDIEGAGKDGRAKYDIKAVQIGTDDHALIADPRDIAQAHVIRQILNSGRGLVFHNSPFDVPILYLTGLLTLESVWNVWDTLIWARGADPSDKGGKKLYQLTSKYLGMSNTDPVAAILKTLGWSIAKWYEDGDLNIPAYRYMAAADAISTARLRPIVRQAFLDRITNHPFPSRGVTGDEAQRLVDREQVTNRPKLRRQCLGILYDPEYLDEIRAENAQTIRNLENKITEAGVTPENSATMVAWLDRNGLIPDDHPRTAKTRKPSGEKKHLEKIHHPLVHAFLQHKTMLHTDAYMEKVHTNADPNGRIHPGTNMLAAATGRSSISGDAALQQYTGKSRGILLADNHEEARRHREHEVLDANGDAIPCTCKVVKGLVSVDWSQIEPVVLANVAGDMKALEFYEGGQKFYHALIAAAAEAGAHLEYKHSKIVLLAQIYGESLRNVAAKNGWPMPQAQAMVEAVWAALPGCREWVHSWDREQGKEGKLRKIARDHQLMCTISGRIVPVPAGMWDCYSCQGTGKSDAFVSCLVCGDGPASDDCQLCGGAGQVDNPDAETCWKCRGKGQSWGVQVHKGVNYFVQGSAYDVLAEAEYALYEAGLSDALYFTMHDEMVIDAEARYDVMRIMQSPPERLCLWAGRTPVLRTDWAHLGERWSVA